MIAFIYGALAWAAAGLIPMLLVGAGLSIVTFAVMQPLVTSLLEQGVSALNGLPQAAVQIALLAGLGESLSIVGSAILTRLAISTASNIAGIKINTPST